MYNEIANNFIDEARELEARLKKLGLMIYDMPKSGASWNHINRAIDELQRAIYDFYVIYEC